MMSRFVKFIAFFAFFMGLNVQAQNLGPNRAQGTFITDTQALNPTAINFELEWYENGSQLKGTYKDNYYTNEISINGTSQDSGKIFNVIFPNQTLGVKSLTFVAPQQKNFNGNLPMSVTARDENGSSVNNANFSALVSSNSSANFSAVPCTEGFGELTGFCGLYGGLVSEIFDTNNRCILTNFGDIRLEITTDKQINVYVNYLNDLNGIPMHRLGTLPDEPLSAVNQTLSNCGPLPGTDMDQGCQQMALTGSFQNAGATKVFNGRYTITDSTTSDSCSYDLSLTSTKLY
jgi:hypothetical protein